jgi:ElaB/YqjD/DUF883 family membrane-anchored ribosome-binding protein
MATKTDKTTEAETPDSLDAQVAAIRAEVAALAAMLTSLGKDKVGEWQSAAENMTEDATLRARAAVKDIRAETEKLEEKLQAQVQEKPLQSLLVAFGIGVIVSLILRR